MSTDIQTPTAQRVRDYLASLSTLSYVDVQRMLYDLDLPEKATQAAKAALQQQSANTAVSEDTRRRPKRYYGIRLFLCPEAPEKSCYLSLPGVPREYLNAKVAKARTGEIKTRLSAKYGAEVVRYWCMNAQERSVKDSGSGMKQAGPCRVCQAADLFSASIGHTFVQKDDFKRHHLVARRTSFWYILEAIEEEFGNIFEDAATVEFRKRLRADPLHAGDKFIVPLCHMHDSYLAQVFASTSV